MMGIEMFAYALDFACSGDSCLLQIAFANLAIGKKPETVADTTHVQAFHLHRLKALADNKFGRAAADVDDQALMRRGRQTMADTDEYHARLLPTGDDFNRETKRGLRFLQNLRRILGNAEGIGGNGTYGLGRQAAKAFTKALETINGASLSIC